ncbi:(d)CMP kinase [Rugosimonospora acidiphila]|uniref:(d)CMP kinase n=1 Tax=Rugosimonospora acidiphila TaxID=556531 RepID=A0ABP9S7Y0_9ACTN
MSRRLAAELHAGYLDTGAMYRAVTLAVLTAGADPADSEAVAKIAGEVTLDSGTDPDAPYIRLNGDPVDGEIRGPAVTGAVSAVSAVPAVRALLVARQREIIADTARIVVEGRDIGSVVAPDANLKVYLTAAAHTRARRRSAEHDTDLSTTAEAMARRDKLDSSRAADPLAQASDAVVLDTTELGIDEVVGRLLDLVGSVCG